MRSPDAKTAVGALVWMLRRRWGIAAWRANVRLLLDRQEYVGAGAPESATRREAARAGATRARQDAFQLLSHAALAGAAAPWNFLGRSSLLTLVLFFRLTAAARDC